MTFARGVLAAAATLAMAAPAGAAPSWLAPVDLSAAGQDAMIPQVALDAQGSAVALWRRHNGTHYVVQAAARAAGAAWAAPVDLSAAGQHSSAPQVAVDPQGNATAIWARYSGTSWIVQATARPAGGAWQGPVDVSAANGNAANPQVAVNARGDAVAVWTRGNDDGFTIVQAAERPAGGAWQTPADLSVNQRNAGQPQVAIDPQGNAVAVWYRFNGTHWIVQASVRAAGGVWQSPVDLSAAGQDGSSPQTSGPQVAVDPQGHAIAVWERSDGSNQIVQAASRPAGGAWSAPVNVSTIGQTSSDPQLAVDARGNAVAIWHRSYRVQAATRPVGGVWQAPVDLSVAGQAAQGPQVAVDAHGNAIATWVRYNGAHQIAQAATLAAGGTWQSPVDLSAAGQNASTPQVAADAHGNAVAVWYRANGTNSVVQAAGFDAAAPRLDALSVPASGTVGEPVSVSVSPFDVWSPLGATTWTFGDGATTTGTAVTHTYANAGTYTVAVDAADALGHTATATRAITIASSPPPPPPPPPPPDLASVTALRLSPSSFRPAASGPPARAAAARTGTRVSYTLNVAGRVRFTVQRATRGRRAGKRCVKKTAGNRNARRCTRYVMVPGRFARNRPAGADRFRFTGRLRGRALKPGRYRLVARPAGGRPARAAFRIVR